MLIVLRWVVSWQPTDDNSRIHVNSLPVILLLLRHSSVHFIESFISGSHLLLVALDILALGFLNVVGFLFAKLLLP